MQPRVFQQAIFVLVELEDSWFIFPPRSPSLSDLHAAIYMLSRVIIVRQAAAFARVN